MAKKDFRNGLQSRLNDLEVKVEDMADGALQSDEIACDTLSAQSIVAADIRLTGTGGAVLSVGEDGEETATLGDDGALEVSALTIGGEAVTPGGGGVVAHEYTIDPVCGSDAASSGVTAYDVVPLFWWKVDGANAPDGRSHFSGKVLLTVLRDGVSSPLSCISEFPFVAYTFGLLDGYHVAFGDSQPASGGSNPISVVAINGWEDEDSYKVLVLKVKRSTTSDIAEALATGTGPYDPAQIVVNAQFVALPDLTGMVEDADYGFGPPPGWPATPEEFFALVGAGTTADPLSFWKMPSFVGAASYEENVTLNLSDLLDPISNAMPWYYENVRIRLATTPGDVEVAVSNVPARESAATCSVTFTPAVVAALGGYNSPVRIYIGGQDVNGTWHEDYFESTVVEGGGGS